jgi:hypothetical protein
LNGASIQDEEKKKKKKVRKVERRRGHTEMEEGMKEIKK